MAGFAHGSAGQSVWAMVEVEFSGCNGLQHRRAWKAWVKMSFQG